MFIKKSKGFTLVETLIALAIIGGVITAVLGLFLIGSNAMKKSHSKRDVTSITEKKISEVKALYAKYPYKEYPLGVTQADIKDIVTNVEEILPSTATVPLWYSSSLSSISGIENVRNQQYNFIISFHSEIDEINQVGLIVIWRDPVSGEIKKSSSTILITRDF